MRYSFAVTHADNVTGQVPYGSDAIPVRSFFVYDGELPSTATTMWAFGHNWKLRGAYQHAPMPSKVRLLHPCRSMQHRGVYSWCAYIYAQLVSPPRVVGAVVILEIGAAGPVVYEGVRAKLARSGNAKVHKYIYIAMRRACTCNSCVSATLGSH